METLDHIVTVDEQVTREGPSAPSAVNRDGQRERAILTAIVQASADAIVSTDDKHIVLSWNPAAERMFGYTATEAIGQSFELIVPPEQIEHRRRRLSGLTVGDAITAFETTRLRKDGSVIDVEITVTAMELDGIGRAYSHIIRDTSERRAAEARLPELEHRYQTFVERIPALTYIVSPGGEALPIQVLHVSEKVEELIGYTAEEWSDSTIYWHQIVHPDDHAMVSQLNQQTIVSGEPYHAEYRMVAKDGRHVWVRDEAVLIRDKTGKPQYWLGFVIDISDLKKAEQEATQALAGQRAANIELERMSALKSEFLSMVSHEIRTPLTSIQGFSELIRDEALSADEARDFAATINRCAQRLARMIRDLLDLERLESGRIELQSEAVDLNRIAGDVLELLAPAAPAHALVAELDPHLPRVLGDTDLLHQVVTNLVGNAIKYSPAGGEITVTTEVRDGAVSLSVRDHGLGIPVDAVETIFSRYARLARPQQYVIDGTGLGLPIARQILELHGGRIWAERAADDVGSIFHVQMPSERVVPRL